MTCLVGENWEVTPYHAWSALAWGVGITVLVAGVVTGDERLAWIALFMSAMVATYNICASNKSRGGGPGSRQEAFEMGRQYERAGVSRLPSRD